MTKIRLWNGNRFIDANTGPDADRLRQEGWTDQTVPAPAEEQPEDAHKPSKVKTVEDPNAGKAAARTRKE